MSAAVKQTDMLGSATELVTLPDVRAVDAAVEGERYAVVTRYGNGVDDSEAARCEWQRRFKQHAEDEFDQASRLLGCGFGPPRWAQYKLDDGGVLFECARTALVSSR